MALSNTNIVLSLIESKKFHLQDIYISEAFRIYIIPQLIDSNKIGQGFAASTVYNLNIPNNKQQWVIKKSSPCINPSYESTKKYCQILKNITDIRQIPHGNRGEVIIELPNQISEAVIGAYLRNLSIMQFSYGFVSVRGIWLDPISENAFALMPKYNPNITDILKSKQDVYMILFQIAHALSVAQEQYRFTHYDLHGKNIFYQRLNADISGISYPIIDKKLFVKNTGYIVKIADYGLSRLQNGDIIINSMVDNIPIKTDGLFNSGYDIASLVHYFLSGKMSEQVNPSSTLIKNKFPFTLHEKIELYNLILDIDPITELSYDNIINKYFTEQWRPQKGKFISKIPIKSIHQIVFLLGNKLKSFNLAVEDNDSIINKISLKVLPIYNINQYPNVQGGPDIDLKLSAHKHYTIPITNGILMDTRTLYYDKKLQTWEWTLTEERKLNCPYQKQIVHTVYIDTNKLQDDYKLKIECCKIDPIQYMNNYFGVTINGSFFDANLNGTGTMKPIGPFRMKMEDNSSDYISNLPIPQKYKPYYRYINILNDIITIDKCPLYKSDYLIASGPILVENGKLAFKNSNKFNSLFQCRKPLEDESDKLLSPYTKDQTFNEFGVCSINVDRNYEEKIYNCEKIQPGELAHGGNPNPRSALILRDNKDGLGNLVFLYIEGRDDRGYGVDFSFLANYALKTLKATDAINLDGGRSSAITWRREEDPNTIFSANPGHLGYYPVGNIISIVKKF